MDVTPWRDALRPLLSGRPWLVTSDHLVGAQAFARSLQELGATDLFVLAASRGTGELDSALPSHELGVTAGGGGVMDGLRACSDALENLPPDALDLIEAWDPERRASTLRPFFSNGRPIGGRPTYGARPEAWQALEDKTVIDPLLRAAGLEVAPSEVVAVSDLPAVWRRYDRGDGAVVAGDNREGFNGGASYVRRVQSAESLEHALQFFRTRCDRVRVMPFLEGLPCSIHAFVTSGQVAVFRPCEMLVFRDADGERFRYAAAATWWDCPRPAAHAMRSAARRLGHHLHATTGYRGMFTLDGVLTAEGFRPTEVNPRIGAAFRGLTTGLDLPMELLHYAAIEGEPLDWRLQELEETVMAWSATRRSGRLGMVVAEAPAVSRTVRMGLQGGQLVPQEDASPGVTVSYGPAPAGGYLNVSPDPEAVPIGPAFAPRGARWLTQAAEHFGLALPPLLPSTAPAP